MRSGLAKLFTGDKYFAQVVGNGMSEWVAHFKDVGNGPWPVEYYHCYHPRNMQTWCVMGGETNCEPDSGGHHTLADPGVVDVVATIRRIAEDAFAFAGSSSIMAPPCAC